MAFCNLHYRQGLVKSQQQNQRKDLLSVLFRLLYPACQAHFFHPKYSIKPTLSDNH